MSDQQNNNVDKLADQFAGQSFGQAPAQGQGQGQSQGQGQGQASFNPLNTQAFNPSGQQYYNPQQQYGNSAAGYGQYNAQYAQQYGGYQQQYQPYNAGGQYNNYNNYNNNYNNNYQRNNYQNKGYKNYNNYGNNNNYNNYNNKYNNNNNGSNDNKAKGMTLEDFKKQQQSSSAASSTSGSGAAAAAPKPKKTLKIVSSSGIKLANAPKKLEEPKPAEEKKAEEEVKKEESKTEDVKPEETKPEEAKQEEPAASAPAAASTEKPAEKSEAATTASDKPEESKAVSAKEKREIKAEKKAAEAAEKVEEVYIDPELENDLFSRKETMSVIFMGHVDAGKSTLSGNVLFLTGSVDKRTVEKYEKEAKDASRQGWYLSWIMDTNKEERNEGKTVETGKAYFETEKRKYTILDAPGHKMYVSEMIGGASQADVGILVISARKGEFEAGFEKGGQTKEHAVLAKVQGVERLVVAINKMDDDSVNWSEKRWKECITKLSHYLKGIGFDVKKSVHFLPVSGYTGAGIKDKVTGLKYYNGPSLLEYLDSLETVNRTINAPFMLPISGKMKDLGTVVEGKIASGHVKKGDSLLMMPNSVSVDVLNIYTETEAENDLAKSGEQVRLKIKGIEEEEISPGYVLTSPKAPVKTATRFEAQVAIVELKSILSTGFSCVMHVHTCIEEVTFTALLHKLQKGTNRKSKTPPPFAKKGMKIIAVLETTEPVCIETYEDYPQLGRFTLRDQGTTIAIGKITKLLN